MQQIINISFPFNPTPIPNDPYCGEELDYGTIMCWADNVVGQQKEPCVFHLIAAGKPEMPYNCSLVNQTSESLEVDCAE
uniref:Uncharacterized protein n=1 Tax=Anopheles christyi TaxID=43041 RepID=A0A182KDC9_9DIPT